MWQTIITAGLVVSLMRAFPAFFSGIERIKNNPRLSKFLDYTICLVTGEVVYSIAFKGIAPDNKYAIYCSLTILTLLLAAALMWYTTKLSKSLLMSVGFFIFGYTVINI